MRKTLVHFSFFFLLLTALSGTIMRFFILKPDQAFLNYNFLLHGHSHLAILGWAFLGVFVIFLQSTWPHLKRKKTAITIGIIAFITTSLMFLAFLYQGYALFSIIFSTLHIFIEYWVAYFIWQEMKVNQSIPRLAKLYMKGAIIALVISTLGPFTLGGLGMAHLKASPLFDMTIYIYLHFQYNGWLFLSLVSVFIFIFSQKQIKLNQVLLKYAFWIYFIALFPGLFLTILSFNHGPFAFLYSVIGAVGQFIAIFLLIFSVFEAKGEIKSKLSSHIIVSLLFLGLLLASKSIMELTLLHIPFASLIFETRPVVIAYLHLTLLGFITILILTEMQLLHLLNERRKSVLLGIGIFILGFSLNELILFLQGLGSWLNFALPYSNEGLISASLLLSIGIMSIWSALLDKHIP